MDPFERQVSPAMIILPCPACGRAVKILGRVRRVLCACGQILLEVEGDDASSAVVQKVG
jgi:hypothetical protein